MRGGCRCNRYALKVTRFANLRIVYVLTQTMQLEWDCIKCYTEEVVEGWMGCRTSNALAIPKVPRTAMKHFGICVPAGSAHFCKHKLQMTAKKPDSDIKSFKSPARTAQARAAIALCGLCVIALAAHVGA